MKRNRLHAFTLPETTIYIAIILLLIFLSIDNMSIIWWKHSFEQQLNTLLNDIEMAKELSLYKREAVRICFYGSENYYRIMLDQDAPANSHYIERRLNRGTGFFSYYHLSSCYYFDEDGIMRTGSINFGSGSTDSFGELRFNFEGVPSSGGHVALYSKTLDKALVVIVKPITGRARIGKVNVNYTKP
jgi:hypothetical protein